MNDATELEWLKEQVSRAHRTWIEANPSATLADLRQYLEAVCDEIAGYDEDDLIADHADDLGAAWNYLCEFPDDGYPGCGRIAYRLDNAEEDLGWVEDLIGLVGENFKARRLLPRKAKPAGRTRRRTAPYLGGPPC